MMKVIEHVHLHINTLKHTHSFTSFSYNNLEIKFVIDFICLFECAKRTSLISNRWFKENWCNGDVAIYIVYTEIDICFKHPNILLFILHFVSNKMDMNEERLVLFQYSNPNNFEYLKIKILYRGIRSFN